MKSFIHSKKFIYTLLTLIMIAGIARFSYGFFVEKKGTHSDEEWSFGLANSYYEPYIYSSDDSNYIKNMNQWLSGDVLKNYLTVQKGQQFAFKSVKYNLSCDTHPPLYFYVLHFFSSFFVDKYVPSIGLFINLFCYVLMSIYFYKLLILICKSKFWGIIGVFFNTFTLGTLNIVIYIRNYMMVAMFAIMFAYYIATLYYSTQKGIKNILCYKLIIVTCLGALTHHYFLPYAFIITFILSAYWLFKKNWIVFFQFGLSILIGVLLSIVFFPATLDHLFGIQTFQYRDAGKYNVSFDSLPNYFVDESINSSTSINNTSQSSSDTDSKLVERYYFFTCLSNFFYDTIGWSPVSPYKKVIIPYVFITIICFILIISCVCFILRKETWFISYKIKVLNRLFNKDFNIKKLSGKINYYLLSLCLSIIFISYICCKTVNIIGMKEYATRYLFITYPVFCCLIVAILYYIILAIKKIAHKYYHSIILLLLITTCLLNCNAQESPYFFKGYTKDTDLLYAASENSDIIIVTSSPWFLTIYCPLIYDCNRFFFTTNSSLFDQKNVLNISDINNSTYLYLDTMLLNQADNPKNTNKYMNNNTYIDYINQTGSTSYINTVKTFNDLLEIYKIN